MSNECEHRSLSRVESINMSTGLMYELMLMCDICGNNTGGIKMVKVPVNLSYISKDDFEEGTNELQGKFIDEGQIESKEDNKFGREKFSIQVQLNSGAKRLLTVNNTSRNILTTAYGENSKDWIGKPFSIKGGDEMVGKNMRWVMYVRPLEVIA